MSKPELSEFSAHPDSSIGDAIKCIDRSGKISMCLLLDADGRLIDIVTDGDIRRGILAGIGLDAPVSRLLDIKRKLPRSNPVTALAGTDDAVLLRTMQDLRVRQMPLVDVERRVVDVAVLAELLPQLAKPMHAVIMAGGFGKRLYPLTANMPKPMLDVDGRPLMELIVERLKQSGIRKIKVTTHFMPEKIMDHFGDGASFGVDMDYVNEDRPLGTGGALGLMPVPTETTLVINGDVLTQVDFSTMLLYHREHRADMTVAVSQYGVKVPYGVIECDGARVRCLQEKPKVNFLVNAGIYLLEPSAYQFIPQNQSFNMTDLIQRMLDAGKPVVSFPVFEQWIDIGGHAEYNQAKNQK